MKRSTLITAAIVIAVTAFISSCNKNEKLLNKKNQIHHEGFADYGNMPTVSNGMLCFTDKDHLEGYLNYLDSVTTTDTTDPNDTLEIDDKLNSIEVQLGYTSLRKVTYDAFELLNETGWDDVDEIPEIHFIRSAIDRSIYNSNGDVKIGDVITHLINKDFGVLIFDGSLTTLDDVHDIPAASNEGEVYEACANLPDVHVFHRMYPSLQLKDREAAYKGTADTNWKTEFWIRNEYDWNMCNTNRNYALANVKLITDIHAATDLYNNGDGLVVEVDWGDGSAVQTFTLTVGKSTQNHQGQWQSFMSWPTTPYHSYPNPGQYTVKINVKRPYHSGYVAPGQVTFTAPDYMCSKKHKYRTEWVSTTDNQRAIKCDLEYGTHWLTNSNYVQAQTTAHKWKNGKWRTEKAEQVVAQMWFDSYNDCANPPTGTVAKAEWNNNKKEAKARSGLNSPNDKWTVIYTNHRIWHNGGYRSHDMTVASCD